MKKLLGINDKADINYHKFEVRLAARAVAVRHDGEIPLLHVGEGDYYKTVTSQKQERNRI